MPKYETSPGPFRLRMTPSRPGRIMLVDAAEEVLAEFAGPNKEGNAGMVIEAARIYHENADLSHKNAELESTIEKLRAHLDRIRYSIKHPSRTPGGNTATAAFIDKLIGDEPGPVSDLHDVCPPELLKDAVRAREDEEESFSRTPGGSIVTDAFVEKVTGEFPGPSTDPLVTKCRCPYCGFVEDIATMLEDHYDPFTTQSFGVVCSYCDEDFTMTLTSAIFCQTRK